jgi:Na+-transporting NADH:ubiquinone oxidoreductase subunit C
MAINKDSNGFTFTFAIIMVIVVGSCLAFLSESLREPIKKNEADKKMMDVLSSIGVEATRANAAELFEQHVKERFIIDLSGNMIGSPTTGAVNPTDKADPFNIDVKKEYKKHVAKLVQSYKNDKPTLLAEVNKVSIDDVRYPLFKCENNGNTIFVLPMVGTGLWGPIWGYVAMEEDGNTVYGAAFDHKTETPGLGAEIKEPFFEDPLKGDMINDNKGEFVSIRVVKGGTSLDNKHGIDGITGGTITSNGVDEMMYRTFSIYRKYFNK